MNTNNLSIKIQTFKNYFDCEDQGCQEKKKFNKGVTKNQACLEKIEDKYNKNQGSQEKIEVKYNKNRGYQEKKLNKVMRKIKVTK